MVSDQFAMDRGTAVHLATALDDAGDLDEATVDPVNVAPYLTSYRLWRDLQRPKIVAREMKVVHELLGYEGRLDGVYEFERVWIVDLKAGQPTDWHPYQTALYALAWQAQHGGATPCRAALYLSDESKPAAWRPHEDRRDFERAKALVVVAQLKQEMGLLT